MSKSTKSSKRAKMLRLEKVPKCSKICKYKHLSILKCLSLQNHGVCMLSLSRVNISYMCLIMSCSYWNVCVGRRHENGGELSEGFFSCMIRLCTYEWDLNV